MTIAGKRRAISDNEIKKPHSLEIIKHSRNYTDLLDIYVKSTRKNISIKYWFKTIFFAVTICSLIAVIYFFYITLQYAFDNFNKFDNLNSVTTEAILSVVTVLIPAISSLIVAFIKIPQIIAEYLFNAEEDNNMNSIIKNIQDYDKSMFAMEHKIDELLVDNKDRNADVKDEHIELSPAESAG
ncbi:MAG: hypothetical protein NC121_20310 [Blautia sp.]|nr:hypothetical protein [Blautia sp.]